MYDNQETPKTGQNQKNKPFFLDFAAKVPDHIHVEGTMNDRECIVYDGGSSKSVSD